MKKLFVVRKKKDYTNHYVIAVDHMDAMTKAEEFFYWMQFGDENKTTVLTNDGSLQIEKEDPIEISMIELLSDNIIF